MNKFIKQYIFHHGDPVFLISVEYVTSSSDYLDDSDIGHLKTLEVVARTYSEYISFFKEVVRLMSLQCDCPAGSDDLSIHLNPVFRVALYRSEKEFIKNSPRDYAFIKFKDEFYNRVCALRS